jgi:oligo-1,6-glucosidase
MPNFKQQVIYQIYPRSFADSNGDGVGDLMGIIQKLDYLHDLGVDVLWLSPIFQSPNADNGYDISDYEAIQPAFGDMDDFDELLLGVHKRGMKLILDLVVNHSSDEHRWFQESRKSKDNPYRDYYIWREALDVPPPNNWQSIFSGPAWKFDEITGEYYLHLFAEKQPDLNWENPKLRQEVYAMMRFWLDKGVDGFRMDVIPFLSKDQSFPDYPEGRYGDIGVHANGPRIHEFLQEMNREVLSHYPDIITIGEGIGVSAEQANLYVGQNRHELEMIYHFGHAVPRDEHHFIDPAPEFTLLELKAIFAAWDQALETGPDAPGWQNVYFGNHDNPRMVSRFGDPENYHYESATLLATVLLTQRGTPGMYQGDEIGMTNCPFDSLEEYDDIQVKNAWKALVTPYNASELGGKFLRAVNRIARDHARTPMQWFATKNAGFTSGRPWLKVNPNYTRINVADQQVRPDSILHFYRRLLRWRKKTPAIWDGTYQDLLPDHPTVWAYERRLGEERLVVLANVSDGDVYVPEIETGDVVLGNYATPALALRPFEARILLDRG